jgi:hypothetical protein
MLRIAREGSMSDEKGVAFLHTKPKRMRLDSMMVLHETERISKTGTYYIQEDAPPPTACFFSTPNRHVFFAC